jgi:oligopeptidase B
MLNKTKTRSLWADFVLFLYLVLKIWKLKNDRKIQPPVAKIIPTILEKFGDIRIDFG